LTHGSQKDREPTEMKLTTQQIEEELRPKFEKWISETFPAYTGLLYFNHEKLTYKTAFVQWHFTGFRTHAELIAPELQALRKVADAAKAWRKSSDPEDESRLEAPLMDALDALAEVEVKGC
jgi:hypothetical protein